MMGLNCKLYRNFEEIFRPSISRQNISNYKVVFQNDLIPVQIYYPKGDVLLNQMIIYITDQKNNKGKELAIKTNHLVFVLEVSGEDFQNQCYSMVQYLFENLKKICISNDSITIMSDTKDHILNKIISRAKSAKAFSFSREIYCECRKNINRQKNKLYLPSMDFFYHFYSEKQIYESINSFLGQKMGV